MAVDPRPLVVHLVYRFDTGGLENGIVNLVNHMPARSWRHAIVALTESSPAFAARIRRDDVPTYALRKPPGHGARLYPKLIRLLRELRPAIVHTRNLAALEMSVAAWAAGVPVRIHGEHGRDVEDPAGERARYRWLRRAYRPFVTHYVALSRDLADYLTGRVGIAPRAVSQIYNGVDATAFAPRGSDAAAIAGCPFRAPAHWLIGTVGRMQMVKNQTLLAQAFALALQRVPALRERARLVMVGEGPLRAQAQSLLAQAGLADLAWLPGERGDVAAVMRALDCFVLPSLAEGVSNTILEAMASGLPVIATAVGGNAELVDDGATGWVVPGGSAEAIADALVRLANEPALGEQFGARGRARIEAQFSMPVMVDAYRSLYDRLAGTAQPAEALA